MKTNTSRSDSLKGSITRSNHPDRMASMLLNHAVPDAGRHYQVDALGALAAKLLARAELNRARGTVTRDTILDMEVAIVAALMRSTNLRLRQILALRYRGSDADVIMPKRRNALASIRLPARKGGRKSRMPIRIRLDKETMSILQVYLQDYRPIVAKQRGDADPTLLSPRGRRESDGSASADHALRRAFWSRMREARGLPRDPEPRYVRARLVLDVQLPRWTDSLEGSRLVIHGRAVIARTI